MSEAPREVFTSGLAQAVDVRAIEKDLMALWKSALEQGEGDAVTRSALLTLVALIRGEAAAGSTTAAIARLTEVAPCRALLVCLLDEDRDPPLSAWASAHCHRIGGSQQVCCEQVTITVARAGLSHLTGLVAPLLVPDLPVFLYWPDALLEASAGPPGAILFEVRRDLERYADFVILDTSRAEDPERALADLALRASSRPRPIPSDLNWSRLLPWREALADLFEPTESRLALPRIRAVRVLSEAGPACQGPERFPARPLLFGAWVADRLDLEPRRIERRGRAISAVDDAGRELAIVVDGAGSPRGQLSSVSLHTDDGGTVSLERTPEGHFRAILSGVRGARRERAIHRSADSEEVLLCREVGHRGADPVFARALEKAAAMISAVS